MLRGHLPPSGHSDHWKHELVQSFQGITSRKVSQSQTEKAEQCIKDGGINERYQLIDVEKILSRNLKLGRTDYLSLMIPYFDVLFKYVIELLIPKHHHSSTSRWRSIDTANAFFKSRFSCMEGYEEILQIAGYTVKKGTLLMFPDSVQEPDKAKLSVLAAELLMAKLDVEQMKRAAVKQKQETTDSVTSADDSCSSLSMNLKSKVKSTTAVQKQRAKTFVESRTQKDHSSTFAGNHRSCTFSTFDHAPPDLESPVVRHSKSEEIPSSCQTAASCPMKSKRSQTEKQNYQLLYNGSQFNFISPPDGNLLCEQCRHLAYEPHLCCRCSSLFCKKCTFSSTCPACNELSENVFAHRSNKLIRELMVWCPNSLPNGLECCWEGELREVSYHRMECELEWVPCSYSVVGCKEKMYRYNMEKHEGENREIHLNLAMRKVVSLTVVVEELQERVEQLDVLHERIERLKTSFKEFKEQHEIYDHD